MKPYFSLCLGLALAPLVLVAPSSHGEVTAIIAQFPAQDGATAAQLFDDLLGEGEAAIEALCDQLVALGEGDDNPARYALTGLARYVSDAEHEDGQEIVEEALLEALESEENAEVKTFLLRQLQQCGTNETVSEMDPLLLDDATASHAILALDAIGTHKAKRVLTKALKKTSGATQLQLLSALSDEGRNRLAAKVTKERLQAGPDANEVVQLLSILVALKGDDAHVDLIAAMDREEPRVRKAALSHASTMMDTYAEKKWRKKLMDEETPDEIKREIGGLLTTDEATL